MTEQKGPHPAADRPVPAGQSAARLLRTAWKASLATLDIDTGAPYVSLVAVATLPDATPVLLLSDLALHTRNRAADSRASLLIDGTADSPDALTGARLGIVGRLQPVDPASTGMSELARRRYLARHPSASMFIGFADFNLYALAPEWGHLVAGFGRIDRLSRDDLVLDASDATALIAAECDIVHHVNTDHADALQLLAVEAGAGAAGAWRMLGADPAGIDLAQADATLRIEFPHRVTTPDALRVALVELISRARCRATVRLSE